MPYVRASLFVAFVALGCDDGRAAARAPSAPSRVATPRSAPHASAPSSRLAQCPNVVAGATTELRDVARGIELVVTARDDAAAAEIRARAAALVIAARDPSLQEKHGSGSGGGGGGGGGGSAARCPVVMKRTMVDARDVAGGSAISVTARHDDTVEWLRRETRERQDEVAASR